MNKSPTLEDIEEALAIIKGDVKFEPRDHFPPEVNERLKVAGDNAQRAVSRAREAVPGAVERLLNRAVAAPTAAKRVLWLRRAADHVVESYGPLSACRPGCAHCCHVRVVISKAEATALGAAIGRAPLRVAEHASVAVEGYTSPCPILKDGACSAYAHRPTICRTHMNMDIDDLLCRLHGAGTIPVPYLDSRPFHVASLMIQPDSSEWADIRQWFPS